MGAVAMSDDPRPELAPQTAPPARQAGIRKRRLLVKAALIGSTVPVVMTISQSALAAKCGKSQTSASWKSSKKCT